MTPRPDKPAPKQRLDQALVERGLVDSRSRAQALILAGVVLVDDQRVDKAGAPVSPTQQITLKVADHPWVSRGGLKLAHAFATWGIDPTGWRCADIGASTGGFTDVLLTLGARAVVAVDSGTNQLAWKLRADPRVIVHEQTNARDLTLALFGGEPVDALVMDVSFISQRLIIPRLAAVLKPGAPAFALIKPQFEVGKGEVGSRGVVRDPALHRRVVAEVLEAWQAAGFGVRDVIQSEPPGPEGNIEFMAWLELGLESVSLEPLLARLFDAPESL